MRPIRRSRRSLPARLGGVCLGLDGRQAPRRPPRRRRGPGAGRGRRPAAGRPGRRTRTGRESGRRGRVAARGVAPRPGERDPRPAPGGRRGAGRRPRRGPPEPPQIRDAGGRGRGRCGRGRPSRRRRRSRPGRSARPAAAGRSARRAGRGASGRRLGLVGVGACHGEPRQPPGPAGRPRSRAATTNGAVTTTSSDGFISPPSADQMSAMERSGPSGIATVTYDGSGCSARAPSMSAGASASWRISEPRQADSR